MNRQRRGCRLGRSNAVAAGLCLVAYSALAGLPEAGLVLYGQVHDGTGALVTEGQLLWRFVPDTGEDEVTMETDLRRIEAPGGPYSYVAVLPIETGTVDEAASDNVFDLSQGAATYTRTAEMDGAVMSHKVSVSAADRGTATRVDVCADCPSFMAERHSCDTDESFTLSLSELLRVIHLHSSTDNHDYHCDYTTQDGFAPGLE